MTKKINKKKLLDSLKNDFIAAESSQHVWTNKIQEYKNETYGRPYGNEVKGKSAIVSKDIKKQLEWLIPTITDPFLSSPDIIKCNPVTFEDVKSARQSEILLNMQFCRKFPRYSFMNKLGRVLATEGTAVIKTAWDYEHKAIATIVDTIAVSEEGVEYIAKAKELTYKVIKNQPTATVCRNEDIFIDPTCLDDMDSCQFVVHRFESDLSTLKQDPKYKYLNKLEEQLNGSSIKLDSTFRNTDRGTFEFKDSARKKLVVYEYWGNFDINDDGKAEPIVCSWIDNTIVRLEANPYPDKKVPFIVVPFNSIPFQLFGEALAENIGDNQKVKTAITRGIIDNMARSNNAQVAFKRGSLDAANRKKMLDGQNFEFNGTPGDFWQGNFNQLPPSVFDMLTLMNNEIEAQTGTKSFSNGINGGSLGNTATAARGALDATSTRRLHLVRSISENGIKPLMRKWLSYNAEFLSAEEVIRVTNEEFTTIRKDDLTGTVDIDLSISTAEDNAAKSQELSFLLQTVGPNEDPAIRREIMAQIIDLMKMPEQAKKIRDYQPQPDPVQQQIQQLELERLQLENQKIRAEIGDLNAKAKENLVDIEVKKLKASELEGKVRVLNSTADMKDLEYFMKDEGYDEFVNEKTFTAKRDADIEKELIKLRFQMAENEAKRAHDKEVVKLQVYAKDRQIGLPSKQ